MNTTVYPMSSVSAGQCAWPGTAGSQSAVAGLAAASHLAVVHRAGQFSATKACGNPGGLHLVGRAGTEPASGSGLLARYRSLYRKSETEGGGPRVPHPGDILYWITCVGAAFLLLLAAT